MPYADLARQREYQRQWMAKRRADWIAANGPCVWCGSTEALEVDHIDPTVKVTHNVWSWSRERREAELAKCRVLCGECHRERTSDQQRRVQTHGTWHCYNKGCRRSECRAAWTAYKAEVRSRRAA